MNLQPLYDVKARLEQAAVAGTGLLREDFRLARAADGLKPLAAASPVFAKIEKALRALPEMPAAQQGGALLDALALVDAVAYTQAQTGAAGTLSPLPAGNGVYRELSYRQLQPILTALTTTGAGRAGTIKDAWDTHVEWFTDYRILPALVADLHDNYAEMSERITATLTSIGTQAVPLLKEGFDPAGKREMERRVEIIAQIEQGAAVPWLRSVLPNAKKGVRAAVIRALGATEESTSLLLDLAQSERGAARDAALEALARLDSAAVRAFWTAELAKDSAAVRFLCASRADWAGALVAQGLQKRITDALHRGKSGGRVTKETAELLSWESAACGKSDPAILDFWRWADSRMDEIGQLQNRIGQPLLFDRQLMQCLLHGLCWTGPGPLCALCEELFQAHSQSTRYLPHAFIAALFTRPAAEVYETFSPYIHTGTPLPYTSAPQRPFQDALMQGLDRVRRTEDGVFCIDGSNIPIAEPLDRRWVQRMTQAVWKTTGHMLRGIHPSIYWEMLEQYDAILLRLADPADAEICAWMTAYFSGRVREKNAPYTYTFCLLRFGGSPRDILGASLAQYNSKAPRPFVLWELFKAVADALPIEETLAILEEVLASPDLRPDTKPQLAAVIPYTIELLRAGKPFPLWNDWFAHIQAI